MKHICGKAPLMAANKLSYNSAAAVFLTMEKATE